VRILSYKKQHRILGTSAEGHKGMALPKDVQDTYNSSDELSRHDKASTGEQPGDADCASGWKVNDDDVLVIRSAKAALPSEPTIGAVEHKEADAAGMMLSENEAQHREELPHAENAGAQDAQDDSVPMSVVHKIIVVCCALGLLVAVLYILEQGGAFTFPW
jgi:hypothetical protein